MEDAVVGGGAGNGGGCGCWTRPFQAALISRISRWMSTTTEANACSVRGAPEETVASEIVEFMEDGGAVGVTGGCVVTVGKGSDIVAWEADTRLIGFLILPGILRSL